MANMVTAVFDSPSDASIAINRLHEAGFASSEINVLTSDKIGRQGFGFEKGSKAAEGAAIGGGIGGVTIAIVAGLTAVGAIASGGLGLLASGPIIAALAGAGAGAAAGGLIGGLVGLGIPEHQAKVVEDRLKAGGTLIGVHAEGERAKRAKQVLDMCQPASVTTV